VPYPPTCVIYNPAAGRGRARKLVDKVRTWAAGGAEVRATTGPGHGAELAKAAAEEGFERVIAAGGDGTVNEVGNGLLRASRPAVMGVWPLGSSNDYAFSLGLTDWWKRQGDGVPLRRRAVDVGATKSSKGEHFYLNCAGVGFNGMVALDSRRIRWLRGLPLYALAYLRALVWYFRAPVTRVRFDDTEVSTPLLALTVNVGVREGGFPITPNAQLDDGRFDYVLAADLRRWDLISILPRLMAGKLPTDHPKIRLGTCTKVVVSGETPLCVHADGEFACIPADRVTEMTFDTLPGRLTVEAGWGDSPQRHRGTENARSSSK
jgi:diacylglycerol kinase (ATP)